MTFEVAVDLGQARRAVKAIELMPRALTKALSVEVRDSAKAVAVETRKLLRGGGRKSRRGRRATSSPGQPPARQTGALAKSIRFRRGSRSGLSYVVLSDVGAVAAAARGKSGGSLSSSQTDFYARFLETGTNRGLQPRPFLTLAQERLSESSARRIIAGIERVLKEASRS